MKRWLEFEKAVAAFVQALDPTAKVTHNAKLPDIHTGALRQRDVWIEGRIGGHLPLNVLVSCKDKGRKLSEQDIDSFAGELRSSSAQMGVLYTRAGFTKPALAKARVLGITCCALYDDQPAALPDLYCVAAYHFTEVVRLTCSMPFDPTISIVEGLFDLAYEANGRTILQALMAAHSEARKAVLDALPHEPAFEPPAFNSRIEFSAPNFPAGSYLRADGGWRKFAAKTEGYLYSGSYCFNTDEFAGSIATPAIDTHSAHPGRGWEEVEGPIILQPTGLQARSFITSDWVPTLRAEYSGKTFEETFSNPHEALKGLAPMPIAN